MMFPMNHEDTTSAKNNETVDEVLHELEDLLLVWVDQASVAIGDTNASPQWKQFQ